MAHLLGSEYCIESLRSDVVDLQSIVIDISSRIGRVPSMSWKFPDKIACDLDIASILDEYQYSSDDVEASQIAHIILLELVIDRFSLLIQSLTRFADNMVKKPNPSSRTNSAASRDSRSAVAGQSLSIGLTTRKHWNKMTEVGALLTQLYLDIRLIKQKSKDKTLNSNETESKSNMTDLSGADSSSLSTLKSSSNFSLNRSPPSKASVTFADSNVGFKSCQTSETCFKPCEACYQTQNIMKDVSKSIMSLCSDEGLPVSLSKYISQLGDLADDWLTTSDLERWKVELQRDITRLSKHYRSISDTNKELENSLKKSQIEIADKQKEIDELNVQIQNELSKMTTKKAQLDKRIETLTKEKNAESNRLKLKVREVEILKEETTTKINSLNEKIEQQQLLLEVLDRLDKILLCEGAHSANENKDTSSKLSIEERVASLQGKLRQLREELGARDEKIRTETSRADALQSQADLVQSKHEKLVERLQELTAQNEELQDQVGDLEDERDEIQLKMQELEKQKIQLDMEIKERQVYIKNLESSREVFDKTLNELNSKIGQLEENLKQSEEEKRLILEYPDLNGPVNQDFEGSGDIIVDMAKQVDANCLRIKLLEEQNTKLRITLAKLNPSGEAVFSKESTLENYQRLDVENESVDGRMYENAPSGIEEHANNCHNHNSYKLPAMVPVQSSKVASLPPAVNSNINRLWDQVPTVDRYNEPDLTDRQAEYDEQAIGIGMPRASYHAGCMSSSAQSRVNSASSSIKAYKKMQESGFLRSVVNSSEKQTPPNQKFSKPPPSPMVQWTSRSGNAIRKESVFACVQCGKTFKRKEDVEIHKPYCRAHNKR